MALMLFLYMLGFSLAYRSLTAATGALLLFGAQDVGTARRLIENNENPEQKRIEVHKLNAMVGLAESVTCRRRVLLSYFGERLAQDCGNCDVCQDPPQQFLRPIGAPSRSMTSKLAPG